MIDYYETVGRAVIRDGQLWCVAETEELAKEIKRALDLTHWDRWDEQDD